jgi:hypothetical protein
MLVVLFSIPSNFVLGAIYPVSSIRAPAETNIQRINLTLNPKIIYFPWEVASF